MNSRSVKNWPISHEGLLIILMAAMSTFLFYRSAYRASNLDVVPDSLEYAVGAHHLVTEGGYFIVIEGRRYPPRYTPWFSLLFLAPAYLLLGTDIGNAIYAITLFSVVGVVAAFLIGSRISGAWGGILSATILALLPTYSRHAKLIMTDVPCTALLLVACFVYIQLRCGNWRMDSLFLCAGMIVALASAARPLSAVILVPFAFLALSGGQRRSSYLKLVSLCLPTIAVVIASMIYNRSVFGSFFRNGYQFWCAVPYDYFHLTFSTAYVLGNTKGILGSEITPLLVLVVVFVLVRRSVTTPVLVRSSQGRSLNYVCEFALLTALPMSAFHLFYFGTNKNYYLPLMVLLAVLCGSMGGEWLRSLPGHAPLVAQGVLTALAVALRLLVLSDDEPVARMMADELAKETPQNALIVSSLDPAFLDFYVLKCTQRRAIPVSRTVEYASKAVCFRRVENPVPPPRNIYDHRCAGLLNAGAVDVVPVVVAERPDLPGVAIQEGVRVFVAGIAASDDAVVNELRRRYVFTPLGKYIYELSMGKR
jgi:4-amino-4-deoxy-L-arabinose transferase-like glycosyltransferase